MKYNHVQIRNGRFVWRLNICGEALQNIDEHDREQSYPTPASAAYACDLLKFFIREKYGVKSTKTELSLSAEQFEDKARREGLDLTDLDAVFKAMPWRGQEFVRDAGPLLEEQGKRDAARAAAPSNSGYLQTLLTALPKRLIHALSVIQKAQQLNNLNPAIAAGLAALELKVAEVESSTRNEVNRLLALE